MRQQAGEELTPSQAALIDSIAQFGPLSPSRLAEIERISKPTITRMIKKLRNAGLVECTPDANDKRSYRIAISPSGAELRGLRRQRKYAYLAELLDGADAYELELIERAAKLILRLLETEPTQVVGGGN